MPKEFLLKLHKTAGGTGYDDFVALEKVREEMTAEWAHLMEPSPVEEERRLQAKIDRTKEWMGLLEQALRERRAGLQRVAAEDVLSELEEMQFTRASAEMIFAVRP